MVENNKQYSKETTEIQSQTRNAMTLITFNVATENSYLQTSAPFSFC